MNKKKLIKELLENHDKLKSLHDRANGEDMRHTLLAMGCGYWSCILDIVRLLAENEEER